MIGSLEPVAVIDGIALTALRTGAVSGLATRYLALPDAQRLVVFGAGVQARSHLDAMVAVRPSIGDVTVVSRSPEPAERLAERGRAMGLRVSVGDRSSVTNADVVCTCTTSEKPLFDGETLKPGAHVNAVGSYQPHTRELDTATMRRGRIVVETREAVLAEAGELLIPIGEGERLLASRHWGWAVDCTPTVMTRLFLRTASATRRASSIV